MRSPGADVEMKSLNTEVIVSCESPVHVGTQHGVILDQDLRIHHPAAPEDVY